MDKQLKIAVILSAYDKMTRVVNDAVNQSSAKIEELKKKSMNLFGTGTAQIAAGVGLAASLAPAVTAFAEMEDSALALKSVMLKKGGVLPVEEFNKINNLAIELGNRLPGTTSDFQNMFAAMIRGGVTADNIFNGTGKAAAYLAVQLKLPYEEAARGAAKMKEATGVLDSEMMGFMDTISRLDNVGVKFDEMQYAFARSAGQLKFLKIQGLEATNQVAALYAMLVKGGASGETVGTGMSTAFSNIFDKKKMTEANEAAKKLGFQFDFIDQKGNFKGVENFVQQLDKLKGFNQQQISDVLAPLFGATGQDSQFIKTIAQGGLAAYTQMVDKMKEQAELQAKVELQLGGLKQLWEAATGTFTNFLAAFGEAFAPELKQLTQMFNDLAAGMQAFTANNPRLAKFIALMVSGAGVFLMVLGVIKLLTAAQAALNVVILLNPYAAIAAAAIAAIMLIYAYWEPITAWFADLWEGIKQVFKSAVVVLLEYATAPVRALEESINKVKELTGIGTKTNFVAGTIGRIDQELSASMGLKSAAPAPAPSPTPNANTSSGPVLNYSPSIQLQGSAGEADKKTFQDMLNNHQNDMMRKLKQVEERNSVKKF
jgi:TP901 family phage tail tape measure protein